MVDSFTVVFDACVLYPFGLRDLLVQLATTGLFRARWSAHIHEEWMRALQHEGIARERLERLRDLMNAAVLDCVVTGFEAFIPSVRLPDEHDRHVVAAAMRCGAQMIVTRNLKHFPIDALSPLGIEAQHPDEFVTGLFDLSSASVCAAAHACRARLKKPPYSTAEYLRMLERQGLIRTAACLQPFADQL